MISIVVLLALLLVASITDVRSGKIYNWTTYSGILIALICSTLGTWQDLAWSFDSEKDILPWFGFVTIKESALGLGACGAVMLICYLFFAGKVGGGDLKLLAMIGTYMGLHPGLEALLWTFVIAGCVVVPITAIWKYGAKTVFRRIADVFWLVVRLGPSAMLTKEEREPLQTPLHLAPSALVAVIIVRFQLVERPFN